MTRPRDGFTFFWQPDSPFSQWHPSRFTVEGRDFVCAEQFMMFGKAQLFGDEETAAEILAALHPREHKALGRKVRGFDEGLWRLRRESIVYAGNLAKFTQNPPLREALLATAGTRLAEASPTDLVWGIGFEAHHPDATRPERWRGANLLGEILTRLRDELLEAER